jgi:polysaccharide export outer membrane protein
MHKVNLTIFVALFFFACGPAVLAQKDAVTAGVSSPLLASATPPSKPANGHDGADSRQELQRRDARYRLCASDVVALTFPLTPEFDQTVTVQPDGFASLAGAGDVRLEGLTTQESAEAIRASYAKILRDPTVSVDLKDFNKPYFIVSGQVGHPGKYDLRGETSATQAVAIAGGFNEYAKHSQVLLFRRVDNDWYEVKSLNLKRILQGRGIGEDPKVVPGDMLYVPQNFISKIKKFIPSSGFGAYYQP